MNFLEFAVWGAYLTCMGNYLGIAGLGDKISWFYAIQGIVSIFMPTLMGIVADKYIQPQRLLGLCHLLAGAFMISCWWLGAQAGFGQELTDKSLFIALYTLSVAFYMPTIALTNTTAFTILKNNGLDTVKDFPPIRVLGTVGFIATMWVVNCAFIDDTGFGFTLGENAHKFQYTYLQFLVSGILSIVLFARLIENPDVKIKAVAPYIDSIDARTLESRGSSGNDRISYFEGDIVFVYGNPTDRIFYSWINSDAGVYVATPDGWKKLLYVPGRGYLDKDGNPEYEDDKNYSDYKISKSGNGYRFVGNIHKDISVLVDSSYKSSNK